MAEVTLEVKIHLDKREHTDPVVNARITGANVNEIIETAKAVGNELAGLAKAEGVAKIDIVNGHEVLEFIDIPI